MRDTKIKNRNSGITLIALVITIIVMLILVAVTINMAINGGLFGYAGKAVGDTQNAIDKEKELGNGQVTIDGKTYASIQDYLDGKEIPIIYNEAEKDADGFLKDKAPFIDGDKTAIIPAGFKVINGINGEQSINNGLVVQSKDKSEFVWIPIDNVNDMFMCQAKTADTICDIKLGEDGEPYCEKHLTLNETAAKKMAGRLYLTDDGIVDNEKEKNQIYDVNNGFREPAIVTGGGTEYDASNYYLTQVKTILNTSADDTSYDGAENFLATLQTEYNAIVKSVIKNKGFYVGRYETSGMTGSDVAGEPRSIKAAGVKPSVLINWYRMYAQQKKYVNEDLKCLGGMIQGAAYDQVMKFVNTKDYSVITSGNVEHNFSEAYETGSQEGDQSKNIYDLEGNTFEWTTEVYKDMLMRSLRGRYFGNLDGGGTATSRCEGWHYSFAPISGNQFLGSRLVLYLN